MSTLDPELVIREHAAFVWRALSHLGVPAEQLEDASQEVLVLIFRRLDAYEGRSSLRTWLFGICRNVAMALRRRAVHRKERLVERLPESAVPAAQDTELSNKREHARLLEVLATLDDDQRTVFVLYELEELSMEEIAESLGAKSSSCYSRLYAAREKVQAHFRRAERFEPRERQRGAL